MAEITINYTDVSGRVQTLSSYEARMAKDAQGNSLYPEVRVETEDLPAVNEFVKQGAKIIESNINGALEMQTNFSTTAITIDIDATLAGIGGSTSTKAFQQSYIETLVCYAMMSWLGNKIPERSQMYRGMFADMLASTKKIALTKGKPVLG